MTDPAPLPVRAEPPLIERARRIGWALMLLAVVTMAVSRAGPESWSAMLTGGAVALSIAGILAVVNVALVRSLYRQIDDAPPPGE